MPTDIILSLPDVAFPIGRTFLTGWSTHLDLQDGAEDELEVVTLVLRHVPHPAPLLQAQAADFLEVHRDTRPR